MPEPGVVEPYEILPILLGFGSAMMLAIGVLFAALASKAEGSAASFRWHRRAKWAKRARIFFFGGVVAGISYLLGFTP